MSLISVSFSFDQNFFEIYPGVNSLPLDNLRKYLFYALTGALASYVAWSPHLLLKRQCKYLIIIRIVLNLLILTI